MAQKNEIFFSFYVRFFLQNSLTTMVVSKLYIKLVEEMEDNDEDMFVVSDLIDTPSNIPLALASFTRWLTKPGEYR